MTDELPEYGHWKRVEPGYPDFQLAVVKNTETGEVLAVEKNPGHAPWDHGKEYQTVLLPENYEETSRVERYLTRQASKEDAKKVAAVYVEDSNE